MMVLLLCREARRQLQTPPAGKRLRRFGGQHDGKVDLGAGNDVEQVGKNILGHHRDDFHDLAVGEAGGFDRLHIGVADFAAFLVDLERKGDGGIGPGISRGAFAGQVYFCGIDFREVEADIAVCREAVVAVIALRDAMAIRSRVLRSSAFPRAPLRPSRALQGGRAERQDAKAVGMTPSCFLTASSMGCEAAGAVSKLGTVMRDMGLSLIEPPIAAWLKCRSMGLRR